MVFDKAERKRTRGLIVFFSRDIYFEVSVNDILFKFLYIYKQYKFNDKITFLQCSALRRIQKKILRFI